MKAKLLFILLLVYSVSITLFSQPIRQANSQGNSSAPGTVIGTVIDDSGKPVEYASIYLKNAVDSTVVQAAITSETGKFIFQDIAFGNYFIEVQFVGYRKHFSNSFVLNQENTVYRISKFKLSDKSTSLQAFEVKAQKEMLQTNLDKTVFNVESSVTADGATAIEVLEDIPSVDVDLEGNVTLRGSENVTILIDGRPTQLTLDQIPSSSIESIEVITNPSARLEPDGMAGILNIILKKKKESGFNGLISLGGDMSLFQNKAVFDRCNGSVNFNYSYDKINLYVNYSFRKFGHRSAGDMERYSWFDMDTSFLNQNNRSYNTGWSHNVNVGFDWFINKKNTLSFTFGYQRMDRSGTSSLFSENSNVVYAEKYPYRSYNQYTNNDAYNNNFNASVNYKKIFERKGMELTTDVYFSQQSGENTTGYVQQFSLPEATPDYYQKSNTGDMNRRAAAQIDFVTPVGNGGRIETGYKFSYRSVGQDYSLYSGANGVDWIEDSTQTNNFVFSEYINALYFIYSNTFWKKFKMQVGVRAEQANTISDLQSANKTYHNSYFNLFPTLHLKYDINDKNALQLSYSRRVTRPNIWQLNPFVDISDKQNLRQGNPYLKPEFANSVELGYLLTIKKSSLNITVFYRQRSNLITRYTELIENDIEDVKTYSLTSYKNLNRSRNFGVELFYGQRLWKFWKINLSTNFYRNIIDADTLIEANLSKSWEWSARLNQNFSLPKNWDLQLNFRYRSPSLTTGSMGWGSGGVGQGHRSASYRLDFGVKKSFFKNSFSVSLNVRDILFFVKTNVHTYSYKEDGGFDSYSIRERDGFRISLNLTYKLNNYKKRQEKNDGEEMPDMEE